MTTAPTGKPTDEQMDERYVIEGDPEEALRRFLEGEPVKDDEDPEAAGEPGID